MRDMRWRTAAGAGTGAPGGGLSVDAARLSDVLARISREALQADGLDEVLQRIVDCVVQRLPVPIASIILLDDSGTRFVKEVWAGDIPLAEMDVAIWTSMGTPGAARGPGDRSQRRHRDPTT